MLDDYSRVDAAIFTVLIGEVEPRATLRICSLLGEL